MVLPEKDGFLQKASDRGIARTNARNPEALLGIKRLESHKCRRWWKRGLSCPFIDEKGHETDEIEPIPLPTVSEGAKRRGETLVREAALEAKVPATPARVMAATVEQGMAAGFPADVAEEGAADAVSEHVFDFPDFEDVAGPLAAAETLRRMHGQRFSKPVPKGFAGMGFQFDASRRMAERLGGRQLRQLGGQVGFGGSSTGAAL